MTVPDTIPRWNHSVRPADLPFTPEGLERVLRKIQDWKPYVDGALLDDVAAVIDDFTPAEDAVEEHAMRLRGHLMRLVNLAVADKVVERDGRVARLVSEARQVRSEELPGDHRRNVGHVRRMAWTVNELLERLVENQCLKEAA
ncbi:DUF6415 family natural product biosynthesis protein [Streptomyces ossamyceticus]|uniref:DUF6415 family natural product biosynthesis protein n=1 Tax=Streptomyces ossamyceticus TaxID=249581 RepID=UPI0036E90FFF